MPLSPHVPTISEHVRRYFEMVDKYLEHVDPDEREILLTREIKKQERLYEQYMGKVDAGLPTDPKVSAFDYVETLAGLGARRAVKVAA